MLRFVILFFCLVLSSCSHAPVVKTTETAAPAPAVTGTLLDQKELAQGGDLVLIPFKAGPGAEANDELDRLSMMIIKGIKESIEEKKTALHVADANASGPKFALQGYIQEYSKPTQMSRLMMHPDRDSLILVGEVWLTSTGQRLLNFTTDKKFNPKKQKPIDVAYSLGHEIGDFIVSQAGVK